MRFPDQSSKLIEAGKEIAPGVVLVRTENDRIVMRDHGREVTVLLRDPGRAAIAAGTGSSSPAAVVASSCPVTAAELARAYLLHSELLEGVARDPRSWGSFLRVQDGALQVGSDAGAGKLLGLEPQDRLERSNGAQLASLDDLDRSFIRPLQQNQAVRVTGTRKGKPLELLYVNAAACLKSR